MKWALFTGTWKLTNSEVEKDVRAAAREVLNRGDGIVTGGATGVDYFAMDEALAVDPQATRLKVIIPAYFNDYIHDYHTHWCQVPITTKDIDILEELSKRIRTVNPNAIIEMPYTLITQKEYDERDTLEVEHSDEVYAFQVNGSTGTQHTIDTAIAAGLPITLHKKYSI